jgi:hypothetical protein
MRLLSALLLALLTTSAAADPTPPADVGKMVTNDCAKAVRAKKQCVLTFDGHDVDGGTPRPDGLTVIARTPTDFGSLIRLRRDFIPEILKTAEDL